MYPCVYNDHCMYRVCRAEEVSEETVQGQQHLAEVACHVRRGGRPEENVRTAVKRRSPEVATSPCIPCAIYDVLIILVIVALCCKIYAAMIIVILLSIMLYLPHPRPRAIPIYNVYCDKHASVCVRVCDSY